MRNTSVVRALVLVAGLVLPQAILFGPSLVGRKLLLPLDLLAMPQTYLPATPEYAHVAPTDYALQDEVLVGEMDRRFATAELRAGRLPTWRPTIFAGTPFVRFPTYSPFNLPYYLTGSPYSIAWIQILKVLVAGLGAYFWFRLILQVGFWPAAIGAWCYPLTGFFVYCIGMPSTYVMACLPWLLLATDAAVRRPGGWGPLLLAGATGLTIIAGQHDTAAMVLLVAGLHAIWTMIDVHGGTRDWRAVVRSLAAVSAGWALGALLGAPFVLPILDQAQESLRIVRRSAGAEDRPPLGLAALAQMVSPEIHGTTRRGSVLLLGVNQLENAACAYSGLLATLLAAPLAWCSRRHRSLTLYLLAVVIFGAAWVLDLPVLVHAMRSRPFNLLSWNRFAFATPFGLTGLAVVGLEVLWTRALERRLWFVVPALLLVVFGGFCAYRAGHLPREIARLAAVQASFRREYVEGIVLCGLALLGWGLVWTRPRWLLPGALGAAMVGELVWSARDSHPQSDPALYYPRVASLERLASAPSGRTLGVGCLPPNLGEIYGLRDVRGYDGMDPMRLVRLLDLARDARPVKYPYAVTGEYWPVIRLRLSDGAPQLHPVLDMLSVRYLLFRERPPPGITPWFQEPDYWVMENQNALPRAFVPAAVVSSNESDTLRRMAAPGWNPRALAFVDGPVSVAGTSGSAEILAETPTEITLAARLDAPGLVVLADSWHRDWRAFVDGEPAPSWRTNVALRGVAVPAGASRIVFRYEPQAHQRGLDLLRIGVAGLLGWMFVLVWGRYRRGQRRATASTTA